MAPETCAFGLSLCLLTAGLQGQLMPKEQFTPIPTAEDKNVFGEKTAVYGNVKMPAACKSLCALAPVENQSRTGWATASAMKPAAKKSSGAFAMSKAPTDDKIPQDFKDLSPVYWIGFLNLRGRLVKLAPTIWEVRPSII